MFSALFVHCCNKKQENVWYLRNRSLSIGTVPRWEPIPGTYYFYLASTNVGTSKCNFSSNAKWENHLYISRQTRSVKINTALQQARDQFSLANSQHNIHIYSGSDGIAVEIDKLIERIDIRIDQGLRENCSHSLRLFSFAMTFSTISMIGMLGRIFNVFW